MIIIDPKKFPTIEGALKAYKSKRDKIGITKELRGRQYFTKPSVVRRGEVLKAQYIEKEYRPK